MILCDFDIPYCVIIYTHRVCAQQSSYIMISSHILGADVSLLSLSLLSLSALSLLCLATTFFYLPHSLISSIINKRVKKSTLISQPTTHHHRLSVIGLSLSLFLSHPTEYTTVVCYIRILKVL